MPITKMAQCQNCQQTNPPMAKSYAGKWVMA
jgi:hypothetical protein